MPVTRTDSFISNNRGDRLSLIRISRAYQALPVSGFYVCLSGVVWDLLITQNGFIHLDAVYFGAIAGMGGFFVPAVYLWGTT